MNFDLPAAKTTISFGSLLLSVRWVLFVALFCWFGLLGVYWCPLAAKSTKREAWSNQAPPPTQSPFSRLWARTSKAPYAWITAQVSPVASHDTGLAASSPAYTHWITAPLASEVTRTTLLCSCAREVRSVSRKVIRRKSGCMLWLHLEIWSPAKLTNWRGRVWLALTFGLTMQATS